MAAPQTPPRTFDELIEAAVADAKASPAGGGEAEAPGPGSSDAPATLSLLNWQAALPVDLQIVREIHRGGQGVVYQAIHTPTNRIVAVKILRGAGPPHSSAQLRFAREVELLRDFRHPGIVTVHDAGVAGECHYIVMDYVDGERLDEHVASTKLTITQTLTLFAQVCEAVNAAHLRGVIHRDLKPSNILVDRAGCPRVVDFGLAKTATTDEAGEALTRTGQFIGSLPWSSPEQAEGRHGDIDTRSDVYSLGVVLYQLLTGRFPYPVADGVRQTLERIVHAEPIRPLVASASGRQIDDETETIVLKCLAKERERRYESAGDLARDIRRRLAGEAIEAKRDSRAYVLRKFVRRHRAAMLAACLVAVTLLAGLAGTTWGVFWALGERDQRSQAADRADREAAEAKRQAKEADARRRETQQVADFHASLFSGVDLQGLGVRMRADVLAETRRAMERARLAEGEIQSRLGQLEKLLAGANLTNVALRQFDASIFEPAFKTIDEKFADQPAVQAQLLYSLARTLKELGQLERAVAPQARALEIRRRVLGNEDPDTLASIQSMGALLGSQHKFAEAEPYIREALDTCRRVLDDEDLTTLCAIHTMGMLLSAQGDLEGAELYLREALEKHRLVLGEEDRRTIELVSNLGLLLERQDKLDEAESLQLEALEKCREAFDEDDLSTAQPSTNLGALLILQGRLDEAAPHVRDAMEKRRRAQGDLHPETLSTISNMGFLLRRQGNLTEAERYIREALEGRRLTMGNEHPDTLKSISLLGNLLREQGELAKAESLFREELETCRRVLPQDHLDKVRALNDMGTLLMTEGKLEEAQPYYVEDLAMCVRMLGDGDPLTVNATADLGALLQRRGKLADAEPHLRKAFAAYQQEPGPSHWETADCERHLGEVVRDLARYADAELHLLSAESILREADGAPPHRHCMCLEAIIDLYEKWGAAEPGAGHEAKAEYWGTQFRCVPPASEPAAPTPSK